jgi:hypothetical protein
VFLLICEKRAFWIWFGFGESSWQIFLHLFSYFMEFLEIVKNLKKLGLRPRNIKLIVCLPYNMYMAHLLSVGINLKMVNPSKFTLISLSNILLEKQISNINIEYSTIDISNCKVVTYINSPKIAYPISIVNHLENLQIINRLLAGAK